MSREQPAGEPGIPPKARPAWHPLGILPATLAGLLLILLVAATLRLANIGGKSLWLDEAFSVFQGSRPELARLVDVDPGHPPGFFTLLHYWMPIFGNSEGSVRMPAALASLLTVAFVFLVGRQIGGTRTGLLAAGLLAVAPLDIWYAQEARMFAFVALAGAVMALGLAGKGWRSRVLLFVGLGVGAYFAYLVLPLWVALLGVWLGLWWQHGRDRERLVSVVTGSLAGLLLFSFWWPNLARQLAASLPTVFIINRLWEVFSLPAFNALQFFILLALIFVAASVITAVTWWLLQEERWRQVIFSGVLVGFVLVTLVMLVPRLYSIKRFLVIGWPLVTLLLAWLWWQPGRRPRAWLPVLVGFSLVVSLVVVWALPKDDWRGATGLVETDQKSGEVTWLDPRWNWYPYVYYQPEGEAGRGDLQRLENVAANAPGLWLIAERYPGQAVPSSPSERWLDGHWSLISATPFYNLEVRYYRPEN